MDNAKDSIRSGKELEFAIFCVESIAARLGAEAPRVYRALTADSDILSGYIVPEYEALHTQSREYIVNDILAVMQERGVTL